MLPLGVIVGRLCQARQPTIGQFVDDTIEADMKERGYGG